MAVSDLTSMKPLEEALVQKRKATEETREPMMKSLAAKGETESAEKAMKAKTSAKLEQDIAAEQKTYAERAAAAPQRAEMAEVESEIAKPFVPTQENMRDLAGMFALMNVVGFGIGRGGKQNALQAMSAMNGMLEGYRQGRDDLYKKEKGQFELNLKRLKQQMDTLDRQLKDAVQTYSTDRDAGIQKARAAFAESGADFYKEYEQKYGLAATLEYHKQLYSAAEKAEATALREYQRAEDKAAAERRHREDMGLRKELAEKKATTPGRGGAAQETALRVMQQDIGNAKYNMEDLKNLAEKTGRLPGGSVAFAQKFTGDIATLITRYAANQYIDEGLQAMDALMLNLAFDIASAQSGGRGQLSDAKVRAVVSQMPLDEQPEATKATKWAAVMTRVEEANKTLPQDKQVEIPESLKKYYMGSRAGGGASDNVEQERQRANQAIDKGADPTKVRERFKQKTGQEL